VESAICAIFAAVKGERERGKKISRELFSSWLHFQNLKIFSKDKLPKKINK